MCGEVREEEEKLNLDFYGAKKDARVPPEEPPVVPMSPGKKLLYYAGSPGRYIAK